MQLVSESRDGRAGIGRLLEPASVAIIGASDDPGRIGGRPLRYLLQEGFRGAVYPVNPNRQTVQGQKAYARVSDLPQAVDCALIAVPAKLVAGALEDCVAAGVKSAIVFSSGFAEVAGEGTALQAEIASIARRSGMRVLGPNCLGVLSFSSRFFATFSSSGDQQGYPQAGPVAIISQSGAYGTHLYMVARNWGLGVSHVITTGNECDVDVAECIGWAAACEDVKVIAAYAEGIKDGPALIRSLEKARANRKPVVFMKVGRSAEGAAAAASHTASLAGSDEIYDAVFRQYGVHRADTTEQMLDAVYACTAGIFPQSRRIGLVTISGGVGVQMADHAKKAGLDVAPMPAAAQKKLKAKLPFASALNPVDTTAQFLNDMSLVRENFTIMLKDGGYGTAVAFLTMAAASRFVIEPLLAELRLIREQFPDRLLILSLLGPPEVVARYRDAGYLTFEDPCRAIDAAAAVVRFGESFARVSSGRDDGALLDSTSVPRIPARSLSEWESRELLAGAGVPLVQAVLARSPEEAAKAAAAFGAPVAMKISAGEIAHKTEIGGVALNVSAADAGQTYDTLMGRAAKSVPSAKPDGVIVAPMVTGGVETILGAQVDPVFGPAVMFGMGGVFAEVFRDVAFRLAPVSKEEALAMIAETRGAALLAGARGRPVADVDALAGAIVALSRLAACCGDQLSSIDLNPFVVLPEGKGAVALDCLAVPKDVES
ncbi:MAG: acetate--CoA ligase family protein [Pseudomonadota bacterium]|nr:acetate--CoA ligase family protein [Pseudomonadota bacterium]